MNDSAASTAPRANDDLHAIASQTRGERKGPLAVERVLALIAEVAAAPDGCSLTGLSEKMATPKTSLLNLLPSLVSSGYLIRQGNRYRLGQAAFTLAELITNTKPDPIKLAQPLLQKLALDADKTVTLAVLSENQRMILHVAKEEPPDAMRFSVDVGALAPVHTTAAGRVMLAFGPSAWSEDFLANAQLRSRTARTIIDREELLLSTEAVRARGYAMTKGETYETVGAISAPVFDKDGLAFALVAAGAVEKVTRQEEWLASLVRRTAEEISARLSRL